MGCFKKVDKSTLGREVVGSFIGTNRLHKRTVDNAIKELGLHRSQHILLMHLNRCGESFSQKALAEHLQISKTAIAVKIKKLESDGFIERKKQSEDGRFNKVSITEKGMDIVKRTERIFKSIDSRMIEGISTDEIDAFISVTKKMRANLEKVLEKGETVK